MIKQYFLTLLLIFSVTLTYIAIPQTKASGVPVFDAANYTQNILNYIDQIKNTINSFQMLENQMMQIAFDAQNLRKMDATLSQTNIASIQYNLRAMNSLMSRYKGIAMSFENMQSVWDSVYRNFGKYNGGVSATDYANQSKKIRAQSSDALFDAMQTQGLVAQLENDETNLNRLLVASENADGALSAIQVSNQLIAFQIQQLMRFQQIMATSYRATTSYYTEEVVRQEAAANNAERMKLNAKDTLNSDGNGEGIVPFGE